MDNLWNCDEKGITMGRNSIRTIAIVRAGTRSTPMTEGSHEFCSVLETISAAGVVIPPFIVWQGKTHRQSYYTEGGVDHGHEATFAVSPSGYMDDKLGLEYLKEHFEPYTRPVDSSSRCLIVDGPFLTYCMESGEVCTRPQYPYDLPSIKIYPSPSTS